MNLHLNYLTFYFRKSHLEGNNFTIIVIWYKWITSNNLNTEITFRILIFNSLLMWIWEDCKSWNLLQKVMRQGIIFYLSKTFNFKKFLTNKRCHLFSLSHRVISRPTSENGLRKIICLSWVQVCFRSYRKSSNTLSSKRPPLPCGIQVHQHQSKEKSRRKRAGGGPGPAASGV